ncbi:pyroglutamyl-peptidase I [Halalkalibacter nanhaiisediminis]|uniref:Pyroglutamyl-peptidase I n=1 Tax=Halalkalibacter nanhaiisediminis TaxID=688079 RepID=A0A562QT84_9BACI|nr:pyroglutamyl-peptidase I [Halalkalibacter nanhaiisediminis]TWI59907.1 pyroglutamyl-peptidase [Halalkalibacter nanhaiisediminis]
MKILISGFEPFGEMKVNPTQAIVERVSGIQFDGAEIKTVLLPVHYDECLEKMTNYIDEVKPDVVISCGLYGGRTAITPERIGINVKDTMAEEPIADNRGKKPMDELIDPAGEDGLFSTLPNRQIVNNLVKENIPSFISNTAGTYICNNTLYGVLNHIKKNDLDIKAGFVHFPASVEMAVEKPTMPTMPLDLMVKALEITVKTCIDEFSA